MITAILLAGGKGTRIKSSDIPKQFINVKGHPLAAYPLATFNNHPQINQIVVVASKDDFPEMQRIIRKYSFKKVKLLVAGGKTRQESAYNALCALEQNGIKDDDIVLIHDMARVLVDKRIITDNIHFAQEHQAAATAVPLKNTIVISKDKVTIQETTSREDYFEVQTPQSFKFRLIMAAHKKARLEKTEAITDDSKLVHNIGTPVYLVEGDYKNFKVTTDEDLDILKSFIK